MSSPYDTLQLVPLVKPASDATVVPGDPASADDSPPPQPGLECRIVDLTATARPGGEHALIVPTIAWKRPRTDTGRYKDKALRVMRHIDGKGNEIKTELEVGSPYLQKAIRETMANYTLLNLEADPIVIEKPYAPLFHCHNALIAYAQCPERTEIQKQHLELLTKDFHDNYLRESARQYEADIENGKVRFSNLWMLFEAGDDILVTNPQYQEVHRVMDCFEETVKEEAVFTIYTWRWGYNASKFGPCSETLIIPKYAQTRSIVQLPYYPLKALKEAQREIIQRDLIARGRKWRHLIEPSYKSYKGWKWVPRSEVVVPRAQSELDVLWNDGRVMVDQALYSEFACTLDDKLIGAQGYELNTREVMTSGSSKFNAYRASASQAKIVPVFRWPDTTPAQKIRFDQEECYEDNADYHMTADQALLAPARTKGFSMTDNQFSWFLVDGIKEPEFQESAFAALAMPATPKALIRSLVKNHKSDGAGFEDVVRGKGHGMVISLEGPPGSGKTLTAESVAELTHKPFYPISTGELGTNAKVAESKLLAIFRRGERWGAVVLLDEADLFLAKRTSTELDRNALVNIFLRNLEYYQGLIFLTSNRVEEFDFAFDSRVHLHVNFEDPDAAVRTQIWKRFLPKTWEDSVAENLGRDLVVNGRVIKNLVRTATLLSEGDEHTLSEDLIRAVHENNVKVRATTTPSI